MSTELRSLGSFPSMQVALTQDSDLVSVPVAFAPGSHTLQYHDGPTISNPRLVLLWCGAHAIDSVRFERFAKELLEFGYLSKLDYAGWQSGKYLGAFDGPSFPAGTVLDSQVRAAIAGHLAAHPEIPQPDGQTIYSAMLPDGVTVEFDGTTQTSCSVFCAYHEAALPMLYTVQPSTNCAPCNQGDPFAAACMVLAHEVAETVSDPTGAGWYEDASGSENADLVAWIQETYGPWTVQGYADPAGNNVLGAYVAPPVQQPPPAVWQPDAYKLAWLTWLRDDAAYAVNAYTQGDLAGAAGQLGIIAADVPGIVALLADKPHGLAEAPLEVPS